MAKLTYKQSGVNYDLLDSLKRLAQVEGSKTASNLKKTGFKEIITSRGESAYIIESDDFYFALVAEGLGTKNLVADEMRKITGKTYYDIIAHDTVISIVMDLTSVGARPLTVLAYWAVGNSDWLKDEARMSDFIKGWKKACDLVGVCWGGGETPTLNEIVYPSTIDLAGAAFGVIKPKKRIILGDKLKEKDVIIFLGSSGVHVNGLTLARKLAERLPHGYNTKLSNGKMYGEELLTPTVSYTKLVNELQAKNIDIHYIVNITGHGWRKLMRAKRSFQYIIDYVPETPLIFQFIKEKAELSDREMYATFNMGAGLAIMVDKMVVNKVIELAKKHKINSWVGGKVQKGPKLVIIKPLNITYLEKDLDIR